MLTALLILWLALQLPVAIVAGKFIKAGSFDPAHDPNDPPARVPVHRSVTSPLCGASVGLSRGEG
jgi:hypothetical protein